MKTFKEDVINLFSNTRAIECPIVSYMITQVPYNNSMLASSIFSKMIFIKPLD